VIGLILFFALAAGLGIAALLIVEDDT